MKKISLSIIAVAALLVAVTFTGCTREESKNDNGPATLVLKIQQGESRAATAPVSGTTSTLTDGFVFITTGGGVIVHALEIIPLGTPSAGQVLLSDLTAGTGSAKFTVPAGAQRVYVFGNLTTVAAWQALNPALTATNALGRNISTLTALNITASDLTVASGVTKVPLYGDDAIVPDLVNTGDFKAEPKVYPVASRVEIAKISGPATEFTAIKVVDILVNYYYPSRNFLGGAGDTKVTHGINTNDYKYAASGDNYFGFSGVLYDNANAVAAGSPLEATPGGSDVWAYNLPAPAAAEAFPHIVLKLEVAGPSFTLTETKYLTVKSATNATGGGTVQFEKGKIYKIADLRFVATDLAVTPEPGDKSLSVKATIEPWVLVNINPSF